MAEDEYAAGSLLACGGFDGPDMARRFVENFESDRGYGATVQEVLAALREGCPWDQAATTVFPEGSFGNGAAMRIAPVGVFYHHDPYELRRVAELSASITHVHPLGKEGAALQACAIALATNTAPGSLDPGEFLTQLRRFVSAAHDEYHRKLKAIQGLLATDPSVEIVVEELGNDVRSHTAVPASIYAFLAHAESFQDAVSHAVLLGGDTDTIAAMTGAIAGAYHGLDAIPLEWRDRLDNSDKGRDYVQRLAEELCRLHARLFGRGSSS